MKIETRDLNKVYIYVNDRRASVAALMAMDKLLIGTSADRGCTALIAIDAPEAAA